MEGINKIHAAVVGGVNTDIWGRPGGELVMRDSNPGKVSVRPGGVGRNIAHDLRLLGAEVYLLSALGDDLYGDGILRSCKELGIDLSMSRVIKGESSSTYLYVTDESGDMCVAVNDMGITERISPDAIAQHMERLNGMDAVVIDANIPRETIEYICRECKAPLYADPVSTVKGMRLINALPRLRAIKPNAMEAAALTGEEQPDKAAQALLSMGVERVFISLGEDGILAGEGDRLIHVPCCKAQVVNTTGAGDSATAAIVWADCHGLGLEETAVLAAKAGAVTSEYEGANNPQLGKILE